MFYCVWMFNTINTNAATLVTYFEDDTCACEKYFIDRHIGVRGKTGIFQESIYLLSVRLGFFKNRSIFIKLYFDHRCLERR